MKCNDIPLFAVTLHRLRRHKCSHCSAEKALQCNRGATSHCCALSHYTRHKSPMVTPYTCTFQYITSYNITLHFLHYTSIFPVSLHYIRVDHISLRRPLHCDSFEQRLQVVSNHLQINSAFLSVTNLQDWTQWTGNELESIDSTDLFYFRTISKVQDRLDT